MENNIIVTESAGNMRRLGREALSGQWKTAVMGTLVYFICISFIPLLINAFFGTEVKLPFNATSNNDFVGVQYQYYQRTSNIATLYTFLVSGAFELGITIFFLNLFRKTKVEIGMVFSGFERFGKAFCLMFMMGLFTFLWSLLFIIPGIIAAYRYSQAFYILKDEPDTPVMECIRRSKAMMVGNKGSLFILQLTFIGWILLAMIPTAIVSGASSVAMDGTTPTRMVEAGWNIASFVSMAGFLWVFAYLKSSTTAFYEILRGNLKADTYVEGEY